MALTYQERPGIYYTEIISSTFDNQIKNYKPHFSSNLYDAQYNNYKKIDFSASKLIKLKKNALIVFVSLNNIFNAKNERQALYNTDYSEKHFGYHSFRTLYFGAIWYLNFS